MPRTPCSGKNIGCKKCGGRKEHLEMSETTVQQSATSTREQIWLNREQVRSGLDGKEFRIHKFRSMCVDAEAKLADLKLHTEMNGPIFKQKDDPRITRVGHFIRKCGIDELPQLWDILVGSMSIVGPRPPLPCEVAEYTDYERQRLYVRPGLTCIWQIQPHRNDITFDEWMDMDMRYIRDRSFWLDWKLIFCTVWTVFAGTGE